MESTCSMYFKMLSFLFVFILKARKWIDSHFFPFLFSEYQDRPRKHACDSSVVDGHSSPYEVKVSQHMGHNPLMGRTTFSQRFPKTIGKQIFMIHNGNKITDMK